MKGRDDSKKRVDLQVSYAQGYLFMAKQILMVEDNALQSETLAQMLEVRGYEVVIKEDARKATNYLKETNKLPDVILLDIVLPERNGIELSMFLKTSPRTRTIPLIAISATLHGRGMGNAISAGFDALFMKPVKIDELIHQIEKLLNK